MERELDPLGLVLKTGAWDLVAQSGRAIRTLRRLPPLPWSPRKSPRVWPSLSCFAVSTLSYPRGSRSRFTRSALRRSASSARLRLPFLSSCTVPAMVS